MITIPDVQYYKDKFKKTFKGCSSVFVTIQFEPIQFESDVKGKLIISGNDLKVEIPLQSTRKYHNLFLSFVSVDDCLFDLLFYKNGFFYETYKVAYPKVSISNEYDTPCYISQVVFRTKLKSLSRMELCNSYSDMIR